MENDLSLRIILLDWSNIMNIGKRDARKRLAIPIEHGLPHLQFKTHSGLLVAVGYERIVIGGRGPYIEFLPSQIVMDSLIIPDDQAWRLKPFYHGRIFYIERRTRCPSSAMVYEQLRPVAYADYKPGLFYVSPLLLVTPDCHDLLGGTQPDLFARSSS